MTVGELRKRLERYNDDEIIDMKCLVENNYYKGYIKDVYSYLYQKLKKNNR